MNLPWTPVARMKARTATARSGPTMRTDDDQNLGLLGPREAIGRAVDLLCAEYHVGETEAFEMLVQGSSDSQETVRENAAAVLRRCAADQRVSLRAREC